MWEKQIRVDIDDPIQEEVEEDCSELMGHLHTDVECGRNVKD